MTRVVLEGPLYEILGRRFRHCDLVEPHERADQLVAERGRLVELPLESSLFLRSHIAVEIDGQLQRLDRGIPANSGCIGAGATCSDDLAQPCRDNPAYLRGPLGALVAFVVSGPEQPMDQFPY